MVGQAAQEPSLGKLSLLGAVLKQCSKPIVLGFRALVPGDGVITPQGRKEGRPKEQSSKEGLLGGQGARWEASLRVDCSQGGARVTTLDKVPHRPKEEVSLTLISGSRVRSRRVGSPRTQPCYTPLLGWQ